jgi:hypothetical protein
MELIFLLDFVLKLPKMSQLHELVCGVTIRNLPRFRYPYLEDDVCFNKADLSPQHREQYILRINSEIESLIKKDSLSPLLSFYGVTSKGEIDYKELVWVALK